MATKNIVPRADAEGGLGTVIKHWLFGYFVRLRIKGGSGSYLKLPSLTTTQRDALTPELGMLIFNSTLGQVQKYEYGQWVNDAATLAGTSASTGTTPATIPVRDSNGKLPGNITGDAATVGGNAPSAFQPANANIQSHISASAPHSGHISHSLAAVANDFLIASGAGAFIKKSLAEAKTILGIASLGDAAFKNTGTASGAVAAGDHTHSIYTLLSTFSASIAPTGYIFLPGGVMLQWGEVAITTDDDFTVTFPMAFPSACCAVAFGGWIGSPASDAVSATQKSVTQTNFVSNRGDNADGTWVQKYIAIGY